MFTEIRAKELIERFSKKQQGGHFACPRCGRMAMNAESITRNALSRRADVYVCDDCGMQEAIEDMTDSRTPLAEWDISVDASAYGVNLLELRYIGRDSWSRPVYESNGRLYVDVDPRKNRGPNIFTKQGNEFDGEPCDPIPDGTEVEFLPQRDVW